MVALPSAKHVHLASFCTLFLFVLVGWSPPDTPRGLAIVASPPGSQQPPWLLMWLLTWQATLLELVAALMSEMSSERCRGLQTLAEYACGNQYVRA
jgi:hypothetical protein